MQVIVVTLITFDVTVFVYGLVAGIVKLNDLGLHLMLKKDKVFGGSVSVNSVKKY
jgi:predicted DNA repair protein MutK